MMDDGRTVTNQWIAGYNAFLLEKYDCHLNVEVCASLQAVKYLYKYIYKGPDRAAVSASVHGNNRDEVAKFEDMRYFGACECCWRLLGFHLFEVRPAVVRLPMHLHNRQLVYHYAGGEERAANRGPTSKLLDWLYFCASPVSVPPLPVHWRTLTYMQFPGYFVHSNPVGWRPMVQRSARFRKVGRLPAVTWTLAN